MCGQSEEDVEAISGLTPARIRANGNDIKVYNIYTNTIQTQYKNCMGPIHKLTRTNINYKKVWGYNGK